MLKGEKQIISEVIERIEEMVKLGDNHCCVGMSAYVAIDELVKGLGWLNGSQELRMQLSENLVKQVIRPWINWFLVELDKLVRLL